MLAIQCTVAAKNGAGRGHISNGDSTVPFRERRWRLSRVMSMSVSVFEWWSKS